MLRASEAFTDEHHLQVTKAVVEAESKTAVEIVPVVATASGRYDRPEDIVGLWMAVVVLMLTWLLMPAQQAEPGSWGGVPAIVGLLALIASVIFGFVGGAILGAKVGWLRRLFTPRPQMQSEVESKAREIFFDRRVHHTEGASGLLVYVSLFERMAVVLGDQSVVEKIGQPALDEMCAKLTNAIRTGGVTSAICETVTDAGNRLASVLPREEGDVNELPDALITID